MSHPFWAKADRINLGAADAALVESFFALKETKGQPATPNPLTARSPTARSATDANRVHVLDSRRANNIEIMVSIPTYQILVYLRLISFAH